MSDDDWVARQEADGPHGTEWCTNPNCPDRKERHGHGSEPDPANPGNFITTTHWYPSDLRLNADPGRPLDAIEARLRDDLDTVRATLVPLPLLGSAEVCERLQIDRSTLSRWVRDGRIAPVHQGTGIRGPMLFDPADIDRLAERSAS